ncbi:MAG: Ribulosamine/erythrulosamine 3-kinase [Rhodobacteraceae bacterium]|nr:MAG: Ribulosamine/erythrulosamine 3-kinase [Paracoccaceae bacterium]
MRHTHLSDRIESIVGHRPAGIGALSGGCVGDVYKATMPGGQDLVAKLGDGGDNTPHNALALEGRMLVYLATHTALPVPKVICIDRDLLLMEALQSGGSLDTDAQRHAAQLIAALHNIGTDKGFGFEHDTVIGGLHQPNPWTLSWREFFAQHRLIYMGREAERAGRLPKPLMARLERFAGALDRWIEQPAQPSLIHGDLWSGNILSAGGRITGFIDPAIYYADAEIELAFTTLFGTFGDAFFAPYQELRPIKPGFFEERRDIYTLYPLLVHVRLFGGSYVDSVDRTLKRFGY